MSPVEEGTIFAVWCWSEHGSNWLEEAESRGDNSKYRVRVLHLGPSLDFDKDNHESSHSQKPGDDHEYPMPSEPLILSAQLTSDPGLFEVPRDEDTNGGGSNPGCQHEGTVKP